MIDRKAKETNNLSKAHVMRDVPRIKKSLYNVSVSRSFKVTVVDTIQKLVTNACYDEQHVYAYLQLFSRYTSQQW